MSSSSISISGVPASIIAKLTPMKSDVPSFRVGDTVKVHARIVEGNKERVQVFQGVVIRRRGRMQPAATFTVRKISYTVGVERTFLIHSPRIDKIEVVIRGVVRRAKLFYLRDTVGKASKIRSRLMTSEEVAEAAAAEEAQAAAAAAAAAAKAGEPAAQK